MGAATTRRCSRACSRLLAPGGVLAIQMPDNREEPTHRAMREVGGAGALDAAIGDAGEACARRSSRSTTTTTCSRRGAAEVDVWRTAYQHPMDSAAEIVEWVRGTGLRPFIDPLAAELRAVFLARLRERASTRPIRRAPTASCLLAFPRLFIVAQRAADEGSRMTRASARRPVRRRAGRRRCRSATTTAGVEARMRKSLELQAELGPVFDVTLDGEDGAPVGGEVEHAHLIAELVQSPANRFDRVGARRDRSTIRRSRRCWRCVCATPARGWPT